jgi:hypothetical protein
MKKIIAIYCMCLAYCYASDHPFSDEIKQRSRTKSTFEIAQESFFGGAKTATCLAPAYYGLMWKSALATDSAFNQTFGAGLKAGLRSMPVNAGVLGTQIFVQKFAEETAKSYGFSELYAGSSACIFSAALSAPGLALMNELTRGTALKSAMHRTWQNPFACLPIFGREVTFIPVLACTPQVTEYAQKQFGESPLVTTSTQILFAGTAAAIGHPFDVWATRMQAGLPFNFKIDALKGLPPRTLAIIGLTLLANNWQMPFIR